MKPLAVDLCAGLGGWSDGLLAEGWDVVGFDIERHHYGTTKYPAQLVLQDILTIDGRNFRGKVSLIVASPPCQKYSYMAMPWRRSKELIHWYQDPNYPERIRDLNALFNACFRIAQEAECPIVLENVRGAQRWVGRARATFGSFYLWGDVPALMPFTRKHVKVHGFRFDGSGRSFQTASVEHVKVPTMGAGWYPPGHPKHVAGLAFNTHAERNTRRTDVGHGVRFTSRDCGMENTIAHARDGCKQRGSGHAWYRGEIGSHGSKSSARKAASAHIAKIPLVLARHIARVYYPENT